MELLQHGVDQESGRRFSVGPCYTSQTQPLIRMSIEISRRERQRRAAVFHFDPGSLESFRRGKFTGYGGRAPIHRRLREFAAIGARACEGEEQESLFHPPRIVFQSRYLHFLQILAQPSSEPNPFEDLFERHGGAINGRTEPVSIAPTAE